MYVKKKVGRELMGVDVRILLLRWGLGGRGGGRVGRWMGRVCEGDGFGAGCKVEKYVALR